MKTRRHRLWISLNAGAALLLAAVIALMVNYLSYRHYYRTDWSRTQRYALSPKTAALLESLENPVNITVFFQPGNVLYEDIHNLLREYQFHSDRLNIQWVDPDRDIALTEEMAVKYQVTEPNVVVFEYGERTDYVRTDEIAVVNDSSGVERITSFRGEQAFSTALQGVVQETSPVVYFLTGHGERDIENFDQRTGYSGIRQMIERDNVDVRPLELSIDKQVPADCAVLIVAGAAQSMSETEVNMIAAWLRLSGRLLVLTDAGRSSGMEPMLRDWGVKVDNRLVIDAEKTLTGLDVAFYPNANHPSTKALGKVRAFFHRPCMVEPDTASTSTADRPQVTPLAVSSGKSWLESRPNESPAKFDADTGDRIGPISMAVAVEKGATSGLLDLQIRPSRIIVFGDSGFASNGGLTGGDASLFMSTLNWLIDREQLMEIAPRPVNDTRLKLTRTDTRILFWSTVWGIPSVAAFIGFILWLCRRK
jgi:hypothetical protein